MDLAKLVEDLRRGDSRALARTLTIVETGAPEARELVSRVFAGTGTARRVGLTGPPGVGKSTLADALALEASRRGRKVAILAIDPTSPVTGGALLGDRARMDSVSRDPSIFVRSMATRGHVGGLASAAFEALVLLEASGKDFILLETVGAGQDEVEVAAAVDVTVVVVAPGMGDEIQAAKAGILEVADVFVVNKADREGAEQLASELNDIAGTRPVLKTTAIQGEGVAALYDDVSRGRENRRGRFLEVWLESALARAVRERIAEGAWQRAIEKLEEKKITPREAVEELLQGLGTKGTP